jgi:outer membrane protein assembly factor BamB
MQPRRCRLVSILAPTCLALSLGAATESRESTEWPRFLGPERNGTSPDAALVRAWLEGGLTELWRRPIGEGFSGITTRENLVFTMDADGRDEYVFALGASDGRERWRLRTGPSPRDNYGGHGPRVTPTVDRDEVFTVSAEGVLFALDARTGAVRWKRSLAQELGWRPPAEGTSSSPLVEGDRIFLMIGGGSGRAVAALDRRAGKSLWTSQDDRTSYSSPVLLTLGGRSQALFLTGSRLIALEPGNGTLLWSYPWETYDFVNVATPILAGEDRVFISSGYDQGAALVRVSPNAPNGREEVWRNREMKNHFNNSVHHEGVLYGFDNAFLKALDAATGSTLWRARGFGTGSLILAGGHLVLLSDEGELALALPSRTELRVLSRVPALAGQSWTPPSLARGRLYLRNQREIACFEPARPRVSEPWDRRRSRARGSESGESRGPRRELRNRSS